MKPLRVVLIISCFDPIVGGGEKQAERLARSLVQRGHSVTVLTRLYDALSEEEHMDGVQVNRVPGNHRWGFTWSMLNWIRRHRRQIDLIHAFQANSPLVVGALASILWRLPLVCTPMTLLPELDWLRSARGTRLRRVLFRAAVRWIAKSDEIEEALDGYSPGRVTRVPNGVDPIEYCPRQRESGGPPVVSFVGRLQSPKRVDLLLQAWQQLRGLGFLKIVGDGALRMEWQHQAAEMGLTNVSFPGHSSAVPDVLRQTDVFVLMSDREGMPNALLEAMSCGLPCIGSGVGAIPELLADGAGMVVPSGDVRALTQALRLLLSDAELRADLGKRARDRVLKHYSLSQSAEQVEAVYLQALRRA